jgi:hypothetical protein
MLRADNPALAGLETPRSRRRESHPEIIFGIWSLPIAGCHFERSLRSAPSIPPKRVLETRFTAGAREVVICACDADRMEPGVVSSCLEAMRPTGRMQGLRRGRTIGRG